MFYIILVIQLLLWPAVLRAQAQRQLDTTTFVMLGEGLAAGMANFGLNSTLQQNSFPAQIARQMETAFPQPLIEGPGIGDVLGYPKLPVRVPTYPQGRVRIFPSQPNPNDDAPTLFVLNLSVPNFTLADALSRRPVSPLVQNNDAKQTAINLILGFPSLILGKKVPLWTQYEYAVAMNPTFAMVELGYFEALQAAADADISRLPDTAEFRAKYATIVKGLRGLQTEVVVTTIPDPLDTAYFTSISDTASLLGVSDAEVMQGRELSADDLITRNGLSALGTQFLRKQASPLPPGSVMKASIAADLSSRIRALNAVITGIASENGAVVYDLQGFIRRIRTAGASAGTARVTANYLGGFYSLDGVHPGATGHALIANDVLAFINRTYGTSFPLVDTTSIAASDAAMQGRVAAGLTTDAGNSDEEIGF